MSFPQRPDVLSQDSQPDVQATLAPEFVDALLDAEPEHEESGEDSPGRVTGVPFLVFDDGTEVCVDSSVVIGRGSADDASTSIRHADRRVVLDDPSRSIGRSHLLVQSAGDDVIVQDLNTVNGTTIIGPDGVQNALRPGRPTSVRPGTRIVLGRRVGAVVGVRQ